MNALLSLLGIFVGAFITLFVQRYDQRTKFRLVSIEKRLQAHQEAYSFWYRLALTINTSDQERIKVTSEARDFWINNCLYLEKNTREEFNYVITLFETYNYKLKMCVKTSLYDQKEKIIQDFMNNWEEIMNLAKNIQSEVKLEPIVLNLKISPEKE